MNARLRYQRRGFGLPIADCHLRSPHLTRDFLHQFDRTWTACHDPGSQRFQLACREVRMLQHRDKHRWDAIDGGTSLLFDGMQGRTGMKALGREDHRRPMHDGTKCSQDTPKAMIQWDWNADPICRSKLLICASIVGIQENVSMRKHGTFRKPSRARRELNIDRIVPAHFSLCSLKLLVRNRIG